MKDQSCNPALQDFVTDREQLISIAYRIVQSREIAEELVQESWLRWDRRDYPAEKARPIFRIIVANLARDWNRRRRTETVVLDAMYLSGEDTRDGERIVIARQDVLKRARALEECDPRVVIAFRLSRLEGMKLVDIAERLNTVPSRIHSYVVKALTHITLTLTE